MPDIDYVIVVWSMIAAAGLTLAAVHLMALLSERRRASAAFIATSLAVTVMAGFELYLMHAPSVSAYATAVRWAHVPVWAMTIGVIVFVREIFPEQRTWLAIAAGTARTLILLLNFVGSGVNFNYAGISALAPVEFWGSEIVVPVGTRADWQWLALVETILLLAYILDAAIRHARGDAMARRRALVFGGGVVFFVAGAKILVEALHSQALAIPYMVSITFLGVCAVMAWELSAELVRAARLARDIDESNRRAQLAARAARAGLWTWNASERQLWTDPIARELHGIEPGAPLADIDALLAQVEPKDRARLAAIAAPDAAAEFSVDYAVASTAGTRRWLRSRGVIERDVRGTATRVHGGTVDVSDERQAEARFQSVFEAAPAALMVVESSGVISYANHRAEELFGAGRGQLHERILEDLAAVGVPRSPDWVGGAAMRDIEARRLDGDAFVVEVSAREMPAADGSQFLVSFVDVTARLQHEREMQSLREQFANASRISLAGQLASTLAHDLSQPLAAILRNAETAGILLERADPDLAELEAILDDIRSDDRRAGEIIDHMRSLLRGRGPVVTAVALPDLLRRVAAIVRHDAELRQVRVQVAASAELPPVHADAVQLQQVLLNLVSNALHALERARKGARVVRLDARVVHDHVEIAVSDTGPGIAGDALPRIFDPFFSTRADGMGMGLAICRSLVDAMGGSIDAGNALGGGAVFRVTLRTAAVPA